MVTQQAPSTTALLEPAAPPWAQRMMLKLVGFFVPVFPVQPVRVWGVAQADLPPAADWPRGIVYVTDLGKLALSNGVAWTDTVGGPL